MSFQLTATPIASWRILSVGRRGSSLASRPDFAVGRCCQRWLTSSSSSSTPSSLPPPLPPSPARAKQEFLKTQDPIQHMARLQKELDIVRERAAERLEQQLKKTVWQRLTDPLKRHSHSWINVGAVLLAYILAHNLYQTAREKRQIQEELQVALQDRTIYHDLLRNLMTEETIQQMATVCVQELSKNATTPPRGLFWNHKTSTDNNTEMLEESKRVMIIRKVLQEQLGQRIGDHVLTEEERRIQNLQKAWEQSLQETVVEIATAEDLVQSVLTGNEEQVDAILQDGSPSASTTTKMQRRVISM